MLGSGHIYYSTKKAPLCSGAFFVLKSGILRPLRIS